MDPYYQWSVCVCVVFGIEPEILHMLSKYHALSHILSKFCTLKYLIQGLSCSGKLSASASQIAGVTDLWHQVQREMKLIKLLS